MKGMAEWVTSRLCCAKIFLYIEGDNRNFRIEDVERYLSEEIGARYVSPRTGLPGRDTADLDALSRNLACARITKPTNRRPNPALEKEIQNERDHLTSNTVPSGILYDGCALQRILVDSIGESERCMDRIHIAFTQRLLATFNSPEMRYHLRTIVCGYPSMVSLPGLVEAPARSAEHYLERRLRILQSGFSFQPEDDHLGWDDPRTTAVAKGYAVQAIAYWLWGDPFCPSQMCRLYNAHTQNEMLFAQLSEPEFCEEHEILLTTCRHGERCGMVCG